MATKDIIDLAIIGAGPAALSAALYAARAGLNVQVFEKKNYGGILAEIPLIENYPGFIGAGAELANDMRRQAEAAGAKFSYGECVEFAYEENFELKVDDEKIIAKKVLIATGSNPRQLKFTLDIPVSYCALCDGALAKDKDVVVVGGANSAVQEALYLSKLARKVTIITHSKIKADSALVEVAKKVPNLEIQENIEPTAEMLNQFDFCFVYIGKIPATEFIKEKSILDQAGYIVCDNNIYAHQTKIIGLFAAGDVRAHTIKQVVTAAADGAAAAIEITNSLNN